MKIFIARTILNVFSNKQRRELNYALKNPKEIQKKTLSKIKSLSNLKWPKEYTTYVDYKGQKNKLTKEKILFYESTSGSTCYKKQIPYNKSLLKSYENAFLIWIHDILTNSNLDFKTGKFFISISPKINNNDINDDRKFLSCLLSKFLKYYLVSDPSLHKGISGNNFFKKISLDLLNSNDMEAFSIWSPTYFLSLLNYIEENRYYLHSKIENNFIKKEILKDNIDYNKIWPRLKFISSWKSGQAQKSADILEEYFPQAYFQEKGLLSTEAPITVPLFNAKGMVPLLTEVYLEFMDKSGTLFPIENIKEGEVYIVIVSTKGGLLRYNTNDLVVVTHFYKKSPCLKFLGRSDSTVDFAGEKISENIVRELLLDLPGICFMLPDLNSKTPRYHLIIDSKYINDINGDLIENKLKQIYHYKLARELFQLDAIKIVPISNLAKRYGDFFQHIGYSIGSLKEKYLISNLEIARKWQDFSGENSVIK